MSKYQKKGKPTCPRRAARVKPGKGSKGGVQLRIPFKEFESQRDGENLMGAICTRGNLIKAWKHVVRNQGSAGLDGMTVQELTSYVQKYWDEIKTQMLEGTYQFQPLKVVHIPKTGGKGKRKLSIPTVMDRFICQAILQIMQPRFDPNFSEHSYGFRPAKSAHQAIKQAQKHVLEGYQYVVDIDLKNFFDEINHDKMMSEIAKVIKDKKLLRLLRKFIQAGLIKDGSSREFYQGVPQGNPLSPLLSNILLDLLDKELERRGHKFVRYADDCNIYVQTPRSAQRVLKSITSFIERKLKLKVNSDKSKADKAFKRSFLGFILYKRKGKVNISLSKKTSKAFKDKIRRYTRASKWSRVTRIVDNIAKFCKGWLAYYNICHAQTKFTNLEGWIRRRLRGSFWRQWKKPSKRFKELLKRGINRLEARMFSASSKGPWHLSMTKTMHKAIPNEWFSKMGLPRLKCQSC